MPFLVGAIPGLLLAVGLLVVREPERGASDHLPNTAERGTILGLFRNKAYWTVSLGMAMMTFAVGGMQVWMPTFLTRVRGVPLDTGKPGVRRDDGGRRNCGDAVRRLAGRPAAATHSTLPTNWFRRQA